MTEQSCCAPHGHGAESIRIGTDIVEVETVAESLRDFGTRYLERIYTPAEIAYCQRSPADMHRRLAARFAAKEACIKVLRPLHHWFDWRSIEVIRTPGGWCEIELHDDALRFAQVQGARAWTVSLSHERSYATAVVAASVARVNSVPVLNVPHGFAD